MKKVWILYRMSTKEILVPSTDYYAKPGDSHQDDLPHLNEYETFATEQLAEEFLQLNFLELPEGQYIILPTYIISK